jgi:Protein of unknown function (DUF2934)
MQRDHDKIRQRAYEIWDREGRQEGRDEDYWLQAERELGISSGNTSAGVKNEAGVPAQARKRGDGAGKSAVPKISATAPRKRRGSQSLGQS